MNEQEFVQYRSLWGKRNEEGRKLNKKKEEEEEEEAFWRLCDFLTTLGEETIIL